MLVILSLLLACDLTPPPPERKVQSKPPKKAAPELKVPDAAMTDTGSWEEGGNLIKAISYLPAAPTAFDDVQAQVKIERVPGMDIDYAWTVNGKKLISARDEVLRQTSFSKGDKVQVIITIEKNGKTASEAGPLIQIANTPPRILTKPNSLRKLDGFRVRADDPDGGVVSYRMDSAPPGLTIGDRTGVFRYAPSKSAEGGRHEIKVVASDPDGGESEWSMVVTVTGGSESKEGKAKRAKAKAAWEAKRKAKQDARNADQDQ